MNFCADPSNLDITNQNVTNCPCCNTKLIKKIKNKSYLESECSYCRYLDRPFVWGSDSKREGTCRCIYVKKDILMIICKKCKSPKCSKCGKVFKCYGNCISTLCSSCKSTNDFKKKWNTSEPHEKLNFYGIQKLKILAKQKEIKGYSKYKKPELIKVLRPLVNENDFPIKIKSDFEDCLF